MLSLDGTPTFDMLQWFVQVKDAINSTLAVLQANIEKLTLEEWVIIEKYLMKRQRRFVVNNMSHYQLC